MQSLQTTPSLVVPLSLSVHWMGIQTIPPTSQTSTLGDLLCTSLEKQWTMLFRSQAAPRTAKSTSINLFQPSTMHVWIGHGCVVIRVCQVRTRLPIQASMEASRREPGPSLHLLLEEPRSTIGQSIKPNICRGNSMGGRHSLKSLQTVPRNALGQCSMVHQGEAGLSGHW